MHLSTIAAASLMTIAALTPADANAQRGGQQYRAAGAAPAWSLTIDARTMRFDTAGRPAIVVAAPKPIIGFAGEIYRTRRLSVNVNHVECRSGGRTYRDTVTVTADGRNFRGCGGEALVVRPPAPTPLTGEWRIRSIDGRPSWGPRPATVRFENGRASGNSGCNSFSASYQVTRGTLRFGPIASTKRFCGERGANTLEAEVLQRLGRPLSYTIGRGGTLVLTAPGGRSLVLERDRPRPDRY
jgi:heat shock protein HslJ